MDPLLTDEGGAVHASTATTADPRENSATGAEVVIQPPAIAALKEEAASLAGRRGSGGSSQRSLATLPKSYSEVQLPAELHPALLLERSRRVRAEQQVEAERQTCLELTRLLELERRKVRQQTRRPSTIADSVAAARRDSAGIIVSFGGKREEEEGSLHHGQSGREGGIDKGEGYDRRETEEGEVRILSAALEDATQREDGIGHLPTQFLFNNFTSAVFQQLPRDLQEMFHVEDNQEDFDAEGQPPSILSLAYRAIRSDNPRQLRDHLAVIGEVTLQSVEGAGLLGEACECGSDGCVRVLLDSGCPPNTSNRANGMSAMHLATQNDHACCISLLLKWGADPSRIDSNGQTPLFIALCEGYRECAEVLMDAGSSLQSITKMDYTVLHAAVSGNMADFLRRLLVSLRTTLDPNSVSHVINYQDKDGNTALHLAASRGFQKCVEVLCGCPQTIMTVKDRWNRTALDISTDDCRDILMSKDSKEVVVCVQARLPDTRQATPIAIGRATILRHYKCLDAELLAAQTLEQYCHSLKGHIPIPSSLESDTESGHNHSPRQSISGGNGDVSSSNKQSCRHGNENPVEWAEPPGTWAERLQRDLQGNAGGEKRSLRGSRKSTEMMTPHLGDLKFLWGTQQEMDRMDLGVSSIASYRVGPLNWAPGELGKQQKGKSLHAMVGDRRGGGLGWITGGKPTEIHITLKGHTEGRLDQLAFELMIPKATLHHYISMVMRDKAVVLHGPQGCGKTYLAKSIAEFIKHKLGPTSTHVLYLALHQSFKRDDLFRMLRLNGLLKLVCEKTEKDEEPSLQPNPHIVVLDDLDQISGYSTPSVLGELLTMLNYRGPLNPTWLDAVHSREGNVLYPAALYFLKNSTYFIATRTQASGEVLPVAVMDQFSHIPLARHSEPTSGVLYRQLVARLIHTRHGDTPHRWDKVYRCVSWVWEIWTLHNNYMKQLDLTELSLGLKHMLQCPVESGSSDNIQSWLCQLWEHHVAPRIEETVLHSRRLEGQHHQQTAHLLLRAVVDRAFRPTCPLGIGAAASLLESLYPLTPSPSSSLPPSLSSPSFRRRHNSQGNSSPRSSLVASPVQSIGSVPDIRRANVKSSDFGNQGPESPNKTLRTPKKVTPGDGDIDTASLDRVKLKNSSSRKNTLRRLRSRTISLFSREALGFGREGGGGGEGEGGGAGEQGEAKKSKPKETGSTLPRIFKKAKTRPALPALSEKNIPTSPKPKRAHDLEDFFDMLSIASSNRFDDQRSPAPKALSQPRTRQPNSTSAIDETTNEKRDPLLGGLQRLDNISPSLAMSMPDLLSDDESDTHSIDRLYSNPERSQIHSNTPQSLSHVSGSNSPPQKAQEPQYRSTSPDGPLSEPLRRRVIHRAGNIVGEELNTSSSASSPTAGGHRASPLATTTYTYSPNVRRSIEGDEGGGGKEKVKLALSLPLPVEKEDERKGEVPMLDRESPDGKYPTEVQVGDVGLPQRTFPDGEATRRHQRVRVSPSDPGQTPKRDHDYCEKGERGEGVREGWAEEVERHGSPASRRGGKTSSPITTTPIGNGQLRPRRVLSEGDRCQSLDEILESEEARSSHILFDAGLGFLSTSPIVKGVSLPARGQSFSGGSPKLHNTRKRQPISEHHEM